MKGNNATPSIKNLLSDLEEMILSTLAGGKELYGLQISETIEAGSESKIQLSFGSLYPALRRLETKKFVTSKWEDEQSKERGGARRRYYKITAQGSLALNEKRQLMKGIAMYEPVLG